MEEIREANCVGKLWYSGRRMRKTEVMQFIQISSLCRQTIAVVIPTTLSNNFRHCLVQGFPILGKTCSIISIPAILLPSLSEGEFKLAERDASNSSLGRHL